MVIGGNGMFESQYPDGSLLTSAPVKDGLNTGVWTTYFMGSDDILMEENLEAGQREGVHRTYFEGGLVNVKGHL